VSHCEKILVFFYDNLDTSDPNDPDVIIKIDKNTPPVHENIVHLLPHRFVQLLNGLGIVFV